MLPPFDLLIQTADTLPKEPGILSGLLLEFASSRLALFPLDLHESSLFRDHGKLLELFHNVSEPALDLPTSPVCSQCRCVGTVAVS